MAPKKKSQPKRDLDERHAIPVDDPEAALRALLKVDPESQPVEDDRDDPAPK